MQEPTAISKTLAVAISDAAIRRASSDPWVRELRDLKRPIVFRYRKGRQRGSWFLRLFYGGKSDMTKLGNWPDIPSNLLFEKLPELLAKRAVSPDEGVRKIGAWQTVGELLDWYSVRTQGDRKLSRHRRAAIMCVIKCHLKPRLRAVPLAGLTRALIDAQLIWPLQERYSIAYLRQIFGVLLQAFAQAIELQLIEHSPVAGLKFTMFMRSPILPRPASLRPNQLAAVVASFASQQPTEPLIVAMATLMLCHGTRISETRKALWKNVCLESRTWFIPAADTKTKQDHVLPLSAQMCAFLAHYRERQRIGRYTGQFLFPGRPGRFLSERRASDLFSQLSGGEWRSHDLRKVARTSWAEMRVEFLVGEFLLNHKLRGVSAAYIQSDLEQLKRDALERWHARLDQLGLTALHAGEDPFDCATATRRRETQIPLQPSSHNGWLAF